MRSAFHAPHVIVYRKPQVLLVVQKSFSDEQKRPPIGIISEVPQPHIKTKLRLCFVMHEMQRNGRSCFTRLV